MKFLLLTFFLLADVCLPQAVNSDKWNTVERMCGKVEWLERTPVKKGSNAFDEKRRPIKKAVVRLYRRDADSGCCGTAPLLEEAVTSREGIFQFKSAVPGRYWVVVVVDGKDYNLPVRYDPGTTKDKKAEVSCSDLLYDLKNGQLELGRVITVD